MNLSNHELGMPLVFDISTGIAANQLMIHFPPEPLLSFVPPCMLSLVLRVETSDSIQISNANEIVCVP